jgi:hypothetical protein
LLFLDSDSDASSGAAGDTNDMGRVIHVCFQTRRVMTGMDEYERAADRCERLALSQDGQTAEVLRRLGRHYRAKAKGTAV